MKPETLNELALFAGAGGGILGGKLLGWKCVCAVEYEPAARRMLAARQDDGCLDPFPIWDDVRTFDGKPWRGLVDVVSGGFPCQDISAAGKGAGLDGERSGLWSEMSRIIGEVRPRYALVENSPVLTSRGLGTVLGDLAAMGYDARWGVLGAIHAGAPHKRERIWIVAESRRPRTGRDHHEAGDAQRGAGREHVPTLRQAHGANGSDRTDSTGASEDVANSKHEGTGRRQQQPESSEGAGHVADSEGGDGYDVWRKRTQGYAEGNGSGKGSWWATEPDVGRVADGVAARVDRLRAIGNGQVPAVVRLAWDLLKLKK
jgi:DNA (cytosine-5)-methyltransferase 1